MDNSHLQVQCSSLCFLDICKVQISWVIFRGSQSLRHLVNFPCTFFLGIRYVQIWMVLSAGREHGERGEVRRLECARDWTDWRDDPTRVRGAKDGWMWLTIVDKEES